MRPCAPILVNLRLDCFAQNRAGKDKSRRRGRRNQYILARYSLIVMYYIAPPAQIKGCTLCFLHVLHWASHVLIKVITSRRRLLHAFGGMKVSRAGGGGYPSFFFKACRLSVSSQHRGRWWWKFKWYYADYFYFYFRRHSGYNTYASTHTASPRDTTPPPIPSLHPPAHESSPTYRPRGRAARL